MNKAEALKLLIGELKKIPQNIALWIKTDAKYWGIAFGSLISFLIIMEVLIPNQVRKVLAEVVFFDTEVDQAVEETPIEHFEVGDTPIEPTVLNTETLTEPPAATIEQDAQFNDSSAVFTEASGTTAAGANFGGLGGFDVTAIGAGPAVRGPGGVGGGVGTTDKGGFSSRGSFGSTFVAGASGVALI